MEKKLTYGVMLTLKEICLRSVTVILWSQTDILASFDESGVEDKVKANMSKLALPPLLTEQMKSLVKPIRVEIRKWKSFHQKCLGISPERFDIHILEKLCWTVFGTVDFRKTAEILIRLNMLYIMERYRLACLYCLDDYIPNLWKKLPERIQECLYTEDIFYYALDPPLELYWPHIIKGEGSKLDNMVREKTGNPATFNEHAFLYSAQKGNKAATEYFFRKLTTVEREALIFKTTQIALRHRWEHYELLEDFPEENLSETICYLLSLMSLEQQMEIYKEYTGHVFTCLLDWPWHNILWVVAEVLWPFLETFHYAVLLKRIAGKIRTGHSLQKVFQKFFLRGSGNFRKNFVDMEYRTPYCLRTFFNLQDSETIKLIFRNVDSGDRKRLVSTRDTFELFYESISRDRWYLVEICLQEATLSEEDKQELKEAYSGFLSETDTENIERREIIWGKFLQFLE